MYSLVPAVRGASDVLAIIGKEAVFLWGGETAATAIPISISNVTHVLRATGVTANAPNGPSIGLVAADDDQKHGDCKQDEKNRLERHSSYYGVLEEDEIG